MLGGSTPEASMHLPVAKFLQPVATSLTLAFYGDTRVTTRACFKFSNQPQNHSQIPQYMTLCVEAWQGCLHVTQLHVIDHQMTDFASLKT